MEILETQDGSHTILSAQFGVSYHSRYGAIRESRHVFIEAGFLLKAITQKRIAVLEIGLGSGLNAFMTMLAAEKRGIDVLYEAVEAFPISMEQAEQLNYPALMTAEDSPLNEPELRDLFLRIHSSDWNREFALTDHFRFKKSLLRFEEIRYSTQFDLVYFDAFAPDAQPELWDIPVLSRVYEALKPSGVLVTYCAKGIVKRRLRSLGFSVEAIPGPPGKREMIRCLK